MISTVTTTVTVATLAAGATFGAISTVLLILLLASKEMVDTDTRQTLQAFGKALNIGILPLLISFTLIVTFKILEVL
ncbi:unnamed protein product [marine sediment metagenome]|uniref:Uncharacterized protein n=1 Tax=marine sediment metagenome TaxID=412755 RepID=X1IE34_9ZZZZ